MLSRLGRPAALAALALHASAAALAAEPRHYFSRDVLPWLRARPPSGGRR